MARRKTKRKVGRPTKMKKSFYEQTTKLCMLGATEPELADFFHVTTATISNWKISNPKFLEALKAGKEEADANVSKSLYRRAIGYTHPDIHFSSYEGGVTQTKYTKLYPPDPTSCIFWLKNRRRQDWRDVDTRGASAIPLIDDASLVELARRVAFMLTLGSLKNDEMEHRTEH